jgi:light-regulated signal transduction histidine kinase (bacteriophytochrome)
VTAMHPDMRQRYVDGLRSYLHHNGELALSGAYELGRWALAQGLGVLDMAALHQSALEELVLDAPVPDRHKLAQDSALYFNELLSPFEMSFRGYRLANEELRQLNETLQSQKRELQNVNQELESFSYSVSHDLRGPLRTIDGYSWAILESTGDRLDAEATRWFGLIRDATRRMSQLIDDMLALAQVTRREMQHEDVDLSAIVRGIADRLQAGAPERPVQWLIQEGVHARGDARLLTLLLENLVTNAWKFTSRREQVRIEFGAQEEKAGTVYHLQDNGAGFDMQHVEKLFRPFSRLHSSEQFQGTGVGLAIVQRVIQRHDGRIWAQGKVDGGARFSFILGGDR